MGGTVCRPQSVLKGTAYNVGIDDPANLIKHIDAELANACRKTLKLRDDEGAGWSLSWRLAFRARLRERKLSSF